MDEMILLLMLLLSVQKEGLMKGGVAIYVARCEVVEGETLTCILEVSNYTREPRTLSLPISFERREKEPKNLLKPVPLKEDEKEKGVANPSWGICFECWAPFPAHRRFLNGRGPFRVTTLEIGEGGTVDLRIVVPAAAFERGECKLQALLFENGRPIASSRVLSIVCKPR
jgi:hypothetical protein